MDITAVDLPRLRDDLIEFAHTPLGADLRRMYVEAQKVDPRSDMAAIMLAPAPGLADGMLIYVDRDMCELAFAAAATLPAFTFDMNDPPAESGLMWFAEPIADIDSAEERRPFYAIAMGWVIRGGHLWINTYIDRDTFPWQEVRRTPPRGMPRLVPIGMWPAETVHGPGEHLYLDVGRRIMSTVKATWLLMRQPLADVSSAALPRPVRRRYTRQGWQPPEVRVVSLRHHSSHGAGEGGREWRHRWLVRGHWRMQPWGPRREKVRPVWIAPHVKGPEGLPMIGGEKVYVAAADGGENRV